MVPRASFITSEADHSSMQFYSSTAADLRHLCSEVFTVGPMGVCAGTCPRKPMLDVGGHIVDGALGDIPSLVATVRSTPDGAETGRSLHRVVHGAKHTYKIRIGNTSDTNFTQVQALVVS